MGWAKKPRSTQGESGIFPINYEITLEFYGRIEGCHMSCRFCELASSNSRNRATDQVIFETERYFAISSIGGFIPGWTLVCPKSHQLNLSEVYAEESFIQFVKDVQEVVSREYGLCVTFEHGAIAEGSITACGANHAHLHIVPFSQSLQSLVPEEDHSLNWSACLPSQLAAFSGGQEYLFCADKFVGRKTIGLFCVLSQQRSQFFRRVLSKAVGMTEFYDYKRYPFEEITSDTAKRLANTFAAAKIVE